MNTKRLLSLFVAAFLVCLGAFAQIKTAEGKCSSEIKWTFDGNTLTISRVSPDKANYVAIPNYDLKQNLAPWVKRGFEIKKVKIGDGINRVGSCAFANCKDILTVEFENASVNEFGWAAFLNCVRLRNFSLPVYTQRIETIAFANCSSLMSIKIPNEAVVEDQAFLSCTSLALVEIAPTAILGHYVFATEVKGKDGVVSHQFYGNEIRRLANNINLTNCQEYGLSRDAVSKVLERGQTQEEDAVLSSVDTEIPENDIIRSETYALVIGNQNYRFASNVPFANHDAYIFAEYCERTLGIPSINIHVCEDATKHIIMEEEMEWLESIGNRSGKKLLVYYAGHGMPDTRNGNRSYLLPVDVYGTKPHHGIALDDFYSSLGNLGFAQVSVFMDACFSGVNRESQAVNKELGERVVEVEGEAGKVSSNMIVFSAAQGNETAQAYTEQGHGLFTYYLLKELQDTGGMVNFGKLANSIEKNVTLKAATLKLRKQQTPTTVASDSFGESWKELVF